MPSNYVSPEQKSILIMGIVLIVFEAIILIIYFVAGDTVLQVLNGIFGLSNNPSQMSTYSPLILTVFNVMFAVAFLIPVVWFFVVLYRKEHGYQFRRF